MPDPATPAPPAPGAPAPGSAVAPGAPRPTVTIDEFRKLDLRIGKIVSAEDHPNANKLYVLKVDIGGGEVRQIVAGIKEHYAREALVGRSVVAICNMQTAKLRGLESQGMVLAVTVAPAAVGGAPTVALLAPEKDAPAGSKVS